MARIAGVDLPRNKRMEDRSQIHLRHWTRSLEGDSREGVSPTSAPTILTRPRFRKIRDVIEAGTRLKAISSRSLDEYQAPDGPWLLSRTAPSQGLPVRGQRTPHECSYPQGSTQGRLARKKPASGGTGVTATQAAASDNTSEALGSRQTARGHRSRLAIA